MDFNAVPWTTGELIDFGCLVAAAIMVTAFPVVYALRARLHDRLAVAMLVATSATALAFIVSAVFWLLLHTGFTLDESAWHWIRRALYLTVGFGKLLLLWQLLRTLRDVQP